MDESKIIPVDPSQPLDKSLFDEYDICITGAAMKQFQSLPSWNDLVQNTWVYARVSPSQKEFILTSLKSLGYVTLMAGCPSDQARRRVMRCSIHLRALTRSSQ